MSFRRLIIITIILATGITAWGGAPVLKATMPTEMMMGDTVKLKLHLVKDRNSQGVFPEFARLTGDMRHTVCGDSIEIGTLQPIDTVDVGAGRIRINMEALVQSFDPADYTLPGILYVEGNDTITSDPLKLTVKEYELPEDAQLLDYKGVASAPEGDWTDKLPDWLYNLPQHLKTWWWAYLLGAIIIGGGIWLLIWYRKNIRHDSNKPKLSPYELAMWQLKKLKQKQLTEKGEIKEYYSELTDILRGYIGNRFGVNALEMTTQEFKEELDKNIKLKVYHSELTKLLDEADFVKFAKFTPNEEDNTAAFAIVKDFVESTRPVTTVEEPEAKHPVRGKSKLKLSRKQRQELAKKGGTEHDS